MHSPPESTTLYSAKFVADALGISASMLRRYAISLESITGQKVLSDPRDGRRYDEAQLGILKSAKRLVDANAGMSTTTAIKISLGDTGLAVPVMGPAEPTELNRAVFGPEAAQALAGAIAEAQAKAQQPLIDQLQALTAQLERLEQSSLPAQLSDRLRVPGSIEGAEQSPETAERQSGALVRVAERIEGWVARWQRK